MSLFKVSFLVFVWLLVANFTTSLSIFFSALGCGVIVVSCALVNNYERCVCGTRFSWYSESECKTTDKVTQTKWLRNGTTAVAYVKYETKLVHTCASCKCDTSAQLGETDWTQKGGLITVCDCPMCTGTGHRLTGYRFDLFGVREKVYEICLYCGGGGWVWPEKLQKDRPE